MSPVRPRSPAPNSPPSAGTQHTIPLYPRRGTQVVRERSAKPLCVGSIPTRASINSAIYMHRRSASRLDAGENAGSPSLISTSSMARGIPGFANTSHSLSQISNSSRALPRHGLAERPRNIPTALRRMALAMFGESTAGTVANLLSPAQAA